MSINRSIDQIIQQSIGQWISQSIQSGRMYLHARSSRDARSRRGHDKGRGRPNKADQDEEALSEVHDAWTRAVLCGCKGGACGSSRVRRGAAKGFGGLVVRD